jgi:hypothetical protein
MFSTMWILSAPQSRTEENPALPLAADPPVSREIRSQERPADSDLGTLVKALVRAGFIAGNPGRENPPGFMSIEFVCTEHAKVFLDLVATFPGEEDCDIVNGCTYVGGVPFRETIYGRIGGYGSQNDWRYETEVVNGGVEEELVNGEAVQTYIGPGDCFFSVVIWFPKADLPLILDRLQECEGPNDPGGG